MYTAHVINELSREFLLDKIPARYPKVIGHHVTEEFGVPETAEIPETSEVVVRGIVDSGDGLQVLIVTVNGSYDRPNGGKYHITWSLDPEKYSPKDSNALIEKTYRSRLIVPIGIGTTPELLG